MITIERVAAIFRVTEQAVFGWIKDGLPIAKQGRRGRGGVKTYLDLRTCVEWYFRRNYERLELDRQRARLAKSQADIHELKNEEFLADRIPRTLIIAEFDGLLKLIRSSALEIPARLAGELEGLEVAERKAAIEREIFQFLDRAGEWEPDADGGARQ